MREIEHISYTTSVNYTNWAESHRKWMDFILPELKGSWQNKIQSWFDKWADGREEPIYPHNQTFDFSASSTTVQRT